MKAHMLLNHMALTTGLRIRDLFSSIEGCLLLRC